MMSPLTELEQCRALLQDLVEFVVQDVEIQSARLVNAIGRAKQFLANKGQRDD